MLNDYAPIVIGVIALIGGTKLFLHSLKTQKTAARAATDWHTTTGKVTRASYRVSNFGSPKKRDKAANSYILDFEYTYTVDGKIYTSQKPLFFSIHLIGEIEPFVERHPEGSETKVYYDPANPKSAVVEVEGFENRGRHSTTFGIILAAIGVLLISIRWGIIVALFS